TLRAETEWVETLASGWNRLVGTDAESILEAVLAPAPTGPRETLYGDGRVAQRCVELLEHSAAAPSSPVAGASEKRGSAERAREMKSSRFLLPGLPPRKSSAWSGRGLSLWMLIRSPTISIQICSRRRLPLAPGRCCR